MEKTWRWFGPKDPITLSMLRQIGVEGIVTALHDVANGEVWTVEAITAMKNYIEQGGDPDAFTPTIDNDEEVLKELIAIINAKRAKNAEAEKEEREANYAKKLTR